MEEFQNIFPRPLFILIFRPEMLKFHPYYILTENTRVEFVIYSVLSIFHSNIFTICFHRYFRTFTIKTEEPRNTYPTCLSDVSNNEKINPQSFTSHVSTRISTEEQKLPIPRKRALNVSSKWISFVIISLTILYFYQFLFCLAG